MALIRFKPLGERLTALVSTAKLSDWETVADSIWQARYQIMTHPDTDTARAEAARLRESSNKEAKVAGPFAGDRAAMYLKAAEVIEEAAGIETPSAMENVKALEADMRSGDAERERAAYEAVAATDEPRPAAMSITDLASSAAAASAVKLGQDLAGIHHALQRKRMSHAGAACRLEEEASKCALKAKMLEKLGDELLRTAAATRGVPSRGLDANTQRLIPGAAGVINLTATGMLYRRETRAALAAQLRAFIADDRAREATNTDPEASAAFGRRAGLYERAVAILTGTRKTPTAREPAEDLCPVGATLGGES